MTEATTESIDEAVERFRAMIKAERVEQVQKATELKRRVTHLTWLDKSALIDSSAGCGDWVSIRVCDDNEEKTRLGVYLGEIAQGISASLLPMDYPTTGSVQTDDVNAPHTLVLGQAYHNPAIFVPSLGRIVFGNASWWGKIESPDHLKQITDEVIDNVWYVQALKALSEKVEESDDTAVRS
jgi:hypothetical protein